MARGLREAIDGDRTRAANDPAEAAELEKARERMIARQN